MLGWVHIHTSTSPGTHIRVPGLVLVLNENVNAPLHSSTKQQQ